MAPILRQKAGEIEIQEVWGQLWIGGERRRWSVAAREEYVVLPQRRRALVEGHAPRAGRRAPAVNGRRREAAHHMLLHRRAVADEARHGRVARAPGGQRSPGGLLIMRPQPAITDVGGEPDLDHAHRLVAEIQFLVLDPIAGEHALKFARPDVALPPGGLFFTNVKPLSLLATLPDIMT